MLGYRQLKSKNYQNNFFVKISHKSNKHLSIYIFFNLWKIIHLIISLMTHTFFLSHSSCGDTSQRQPTNQIFSLSYRSITLLHSNQPIKTYSNKSHFVLEQEISSTLSPFLLFLHCHLSQVMVSRCGRAIDDSRSTKDPIMTRGQAK